MSEVTMHDNARTPSDAEYCHERLGVRFAEALSEYDTSRRVQVLIDDFLSDAMVQGRRILDVGCGLGFFSQRLVQRGAHVVACDIGPTLVQETRQRAGCEAVVADALRLADYFGRNAFDGVVSSECIEHLPDPSEGLSQMVQVVRPGGFLSISTPNLPWYPVVRLATRLGLRPFNGHEHFSTWRSLGHALTTAGAAVEREYGLHLFPFQIPLHGLSTFLDRKLQGARKWMINICVLARKADPNSVGHHVIP